MTTEATIWLWVTDIALLGLAYMIGRIHGTTIHQRRYIQELTDFAHDIQRIEKKIDRIQPQ